MSSFTKLQLFTWNEDIFVDIYAYINALQQQHSYCPSAWSHVSRGTRCMKLRSSSWTWLPQGTWKFFKWYSSARVVQHISLVPRAVISLRWLHVIVLFTNAIGTLISSYSERWDSMVRKNRSYVLLVTAVRTIVRVLAFCSKVKEG